MASSSNVDFGGNSGDQIVPHVGVNQRKKRKINVEENVTVIRQAFLTTLKYTTNETFRQKFLKELQANNSKEATEKLSELLNNLSQKVHGMDPGVENLNAHLNDATPPSSGSSSAAQGLDEADYIEQNIIASMYPSDKDISEPSTSGIRQTKGTTKRKDWFEELLVEDSDL